MIHDTASPLPHYTVFATPPLSELELHPIRRRERYKNTQKMFLNTYTVKLPILDTAYEKTPYNSSNRQPYTKAWLHVHGQGTRRILVTDLRNLPIWRYSGDSWRTALRNGKFHSFFPKTRPASHFLHGFPSFVLVGATGKHDRLAGRQRWANTLT